MSTILTRDKSAVIAVWEMQEKPCFSIWDNAKAPAFSCSDPDKLEEQLNYYLNFIKDSGTSSIFTIKFHEEPARGKINNTTPVTGSLPFRLNEERALRAEGSSGGGGGGSIELLNQLFAEKLNFLEYKYQEKIQKLEEEKEELQAELDEEPEQDPEEMGSIGRVLKYCGNDPVLKEPVTDILKSVASFIKDALVVGKHKLNNTVTGAINGVGTAGAAAAPITEKIAEDYERPDIKLNAALEKLRDWYIGVAATGQPAETEEDKKAIYLKGFNQLADDMTMLANLTADDDMINLALKKLRSIG